MWSVISFSVERRKAIVNFLNYTFSEPKLPNSSNEVIDTTEISQNLALFNSLQLINNYQNFEIVLQKWNEPKYILNGLDTELAGKVNDIARKAKLFDALYFAASAWDSVTDTKIRNRFKKKEWPRHKINMWT